MTSSPTTSHPHTQRPKALVEVTAVVALVLAALLAVAGCSSTKATPEQQALGTWGCRTGTPETAYKVTVAKDGTWTFSFAERQHAKGTWTHKGSLVQVDFTDPDKPTEKVRFTMAPAPKAATASGGAPKQVVVHAYRSTNGTTYTEVPGSPVTATYATGPKNNGLASTVGAVNCVKASPVQS